MLPSTGWLTSPIDNNQLDIALAELYQQIYRDGQIENLIVPIDNPKLPDGSDPLFIVVSAGFMEAELFHAAAPDGSTGFWVELRRTGVFGVLLLDTIYVQILGPQPVQENCPDTTEDTPEPDATTVSFAEEACGSMSVIEEICGTLSVVEET